MRNIVVPTDGSAGANGAVDVAAELTKACSGKLFIVTIAGDIPWEEIRELERAGKNIGGALEGHSMEILNAAEKRAQRFGVTDIELQIGWGDPATSIIKIAAREAADTIVLGRRGRGRMAGLLLGSVARKVVSLAPCPVIVVPEPAERSPDNAPWS